MLGSGLAGRPSNASGGLDPSFPMFRPAGLGIDAEDDLRNGLASAADGGAASAPGGVSPHGDEYDIFIGMNQEGDGEAEAENDDDPVPSLEHDVSSRK